MSHILKNKLSLYVFTYFMIFTCLSYSQELVDKDNELLYSDLTKSKIVALGDATHTDYTASKYRVDLIKDLIVNHNYTIIAIESNLYQVYKAFEDFKASEDIKQMNSSVFYQVRNQYLDDLFYYVKDQNQKGKNIKVYGFDASFSGDNTYEDFTKPMIQGLSNTPVECNGISFDLFCKKFKNLVPTNLKALLRTHSDYQVVHDYLTCYLDQSKASTNSSEVFNRALSNTLATVQGRFNGKDSDNTRDSLMFNNIVYLKNKYPGEKMILFGSNSHFIKSPQTINSKYMPSDKWKSLGQRLHKEFGQDYFFIAYTAVSGNTRGFHGKKVKLKNLIASSIENSVNQSYDTSVEIMYLSTNRDKSILDQNSYSRILGNTFQQMDISANVDGLFLIRNNNTVF